jgi:hypothetical protein
VFLSGVALVQTAGRRRLRPAESATEVKRAA